MKIKFLSYNGDLIGLTVNKNYLIFRWTEPNCKVLFSVCRQGNGASCHFASDKKGVFKIKRAINEWCEFVFWLFDRAELIFAKVNHKSVAKLIARCGFIMIYSKNDKSIWIRCR